MLAMKGQTVLKRLLSTHLCLVCLGTSFFAHSQETPPPDAFAIGDTQLWLEIVINGSPTGEVLGIEYRDQHYWLTAEQVETIGLAQLNPKKAPFVAIDLLPKITVEYLSSMQQLMISVPASWLPKQHLKSEKTIYREEQKSHSSTGALFNYDMYVSSPQGDAASIFSLWSEQRLFSNYGIVANTGIYRYIFSGEDNSNISNRYLRYDSFWQYSHENSMTTFVLGDLVTDSLSWSNSIRIGGLKVRRNFSTRPDLITYPLPQFSGDAAVPTSIDLFIENYKMQSHMLEPGPFTIESQPFISGAGSATVVTTDAHGRQVSTTVPFYVASQLLAQGLFDFSLSAGAIRQNYGLHSNDYNYGVVSGTAQYGLTHWLTAEGRIDAANSMTSGGLGLGLRLWVLGVLNASYSMSDSKEQAWKRPNQNERLEDNSNTQDEITQNTTPRFGEGHQSVLGYSYNNHLFSINAQRIWRSPNYVDLANYRSSHRLSRRQDQITGSIGLGVLGSIGAGYFSVKNEKEETELLNLSWSKSFPRNVYFYSSLNKELGNNDLSLMFMLSVPLGDMGHTSLSTQKSNDNHWTTRASWNKSSPLNGGIGWNLSIAEGKRSEDKYQQADLSWRSHYFDTRGGVYGSSNNYTGWAEFSGAIIAMGSGIYTTNSVTDAFAVVSTNGFPDIPVYYENQFIGKTDHKGYLLIPTVTAWYPAKIAIDSIQLPADIDIPATDRSLSIRERSGLNIDFGLKRIHSLYVSVVTLDEEFVPKGSIVQVDNGDISWVGWDGIVWLKDARAKNRLVITNANTGQVCELWVETSPTENITHAGRKVCQ